MGLPKALILDPLIARARLIMVVSASICNYLRVETNTEDNKQWRLLHHPTLDFLAALVVLRLQRCSSLFLRTVF